MLMTRSSKPLLFFSLKELFRETFKAIAAPIRTDAWTDPKVKLVEDKSVLVRVLATSIIPQDDTFKLLHKKRSLR